MLRNGKAVPVARVLGRSSHGDTVTGLGLHVRSVSCEDNLTAVTRGSLPLPCQDHAYFARPGMLMRRKPR